MHSPELDETHPTSMKPDEHSLPEAGDPQATNTSPTNQEADAGATQAMDVRPVDKRVELSSHASAEKSIRISRN